MLTLFHYVLAGITALFACIPIIHVAFGAIIVLSPAHMNAPEALPFRLFGLFFMVMGAVAILMGWTMAVLTFISGRCIAKREKRTFSMVVAGIQCVFVPFGTVLGIFTLLVLQRNSVRQLYTS